MEWLSLRFTPEIGEKVNIKLKDGSILKNCLPQIDGDYYWELPYYSEIFIPESLVTHWMPLPDDPKP